MANPHGSFIWYELLTSDPDAASAFYGAVVGWSVRPSGQAGMDYRLFKASASDVAGLMKLPEPAAQAGTPPLWVGYIGVRDVDATVAAIEASGGTVHMPPMDLPDVGRFAFVSDPQGATFYVMRGASDEASDAFAPKQRGHCAWHELHTSNWEAALSFYAKHFDWTVADKMDMGPMGTYLLFKAGGDELAGGMMNSPNFPRPLWLYYFNVDDIDAAEQRLTKHGGKLLHGPAEVPGGDFMIQATDPQGALFALVGPRKQ